MSLNCFHFPCRLKTKTQGGPIKSNFFCQNSWLSSRMKFVKVAFVLVRKLTTLSFLPFSSGSSRLTEMAVSPSLAYLLCNSTSCGNSFLQGTHHSAQKSMTITLPFSCLTVLASSGYLITLTCAFSSAWACPARDRTSNTDHLALKSVPISLFDKEANKADLHGFKTIPLPWILS